MLTNNITGSQPFQTVNDQTPPDTAKAIVNINLKNTVHRFPRKKSKKKVKAKEMDQQQIKTLNRNPTNLTFNVNEYSLINQPSRHNSRESLNYTNLMT